MATILDLGNVIGPQGPKGDTGADGVSVTHSWDGTTLSITSASGTSAVDLKGEKGDTGAQGEAGKTPTFTINDEGHLIATFE